MDNIKNDFQIFENAELGSVRTVLDENRIIWFIARDVCSVLEISNYRDALRRLDADEKKLCQIETAGGVQWTNLINEYGLYNLIFTSRRPEAKEFKKWLTHEVIPSIREHGGYIYDQEKLTDIDRAALMTQIESLAQSVQKFKKRWHELVREKNGLQAEKKDLKKKVKALNEYAMTQEEMYDALYVDFVRTYYDNKKLKAELYKKQELISDNLADFTEENEPTYYLDRNGFLISTDENRYKNNMDEYER